MSIGYAILSRKLYITGISKVNGKFSVVITDIYITQNKTKFDDLSTARKNLSGDNSLSDNFDKINKFFKISKIIFYYCQRFIFFPFSIFFNIT